MKTIHMAAIGEFEHNIRMHFFVDVLGKMGVQHELENVERAEGWDDFLKHNSEKWDLVWLGGDEQMSCALEYFRAPSQVRTIGVSDFIIGEKKSYWPQCYIQKAFDKLLYEKASRLDTHSAAYVIGTGPDAWVAVFCLVKLGFGKLILVGQDGDNMNYFVEALRRKYFSVKFEVLEPSALTLQASTASCLVNTVSELQAPKILADLYYLNFTKKEALIVDFNLLPVKGQLLVEAEHVKSPIIAGWELWGWADSFAIEGLLGADLLDTKKYFNDWNTFIHSENSPG